MFAWPPTLDHLPSGFDAGRMQRTTEGLLEARGWPADPRVAKLLGFAAGCSPFLAHSLIREASGLKRLCDAGPTAFVTAEIEGAASAGELSSREEMAAALRIAKRRCALAIALGDLAGLFDLDAVTGALTDLADAALESALRFALRAEMSGGRYAPRDPKDPVRDSGIIVLAMGKYGARELNYSSDIDFTVFFDRDRLPVAPGVEPVPFLVRVVQSVVNALQQRTADGYVFRTDLRLRPDAGATQIAISTTAALIYYEGMGQNWERAAMIKARACAGDIAAGEAFLADLRPFIWRKYLDFAAVADIHAIKRQIHAAKGGAAVTVAGHDIKLGRGGIREIEFFAQTQQLILGGRYPQLRSRRTLDAIHALTTENVVDLNAERDLNVAYNYLRKLEHRLQMVADEQTHRVPEDEVARANVGRFMQFENLAAFDDATRTVLRTVERHYAALFETSASLGAGQGSLVFTGVEDDPETLKTLAGLGFKRPDSIAAAIRAWHHGRMAATRSSRARELLTELMPALLDALGKTADADVAFARFDALLTRLPAGVQLFSLLKVNPRLLTVLAEICGAAPRLATHMARSPSVLDALFDPAFLAQPLERAEIDAAFQRSLQEAADYEAVLDATRRTARELTFRVGMQLFQGRLGPEEVGSAYADIADSAVIALLARVRAAFEASHGRVKGGVFAVIALGRLGAQKMTASSDLDLVFLYDHAEDADVSTGKAPLAPSVYFARLSQRLIAALTAQTAEGRLYEVDMRLRPSGSKGPVAVRLRTFEAYQAEDAWTWERMALTRARVVSADAGFGERVAVGIRKALTRFVEPSVIRADALQMRVLLLKEKPAKTPFDLKMARGGMIDVEFVAQAQQLIAGQSHPDVFSGSTFEALQRLRRTGALSPEDVAALSDAYLLFTRVNHMLRLVSEDDAAAVTEAGLQNLLVRAARANSFAALTEQLAVTRADVSARFARLIGPLP